MKKMRRTRKHPFEFIASRCFSCFMFTQSSHIQVAHLVLHFSKKTRISKRQTLSKASLVDGNRICQNVKVCLQSTPNFVLFRLLEGLDHVLGYYIATHCWWATVSYAELRNKGRLIGWEQLENPGILLANPKCHSKRVKLRDWKSVISLELSSLSLQRQWNSAKI